jgi:hypothetical protein
MSFRGTALLFGVLMGMLWFFGLMTSMKQSERDETFLFPALQANIDITIDAVRIDKHESGKTTELRFARTDEGWFMEEPPAKVQARADSFKIDQLIRQVRDTRKFEEADIAHDPGRYDLTKPRIVVTLKGKAEKKKGLGEEWVLNVGKERADKAVVYVNTAARPEKVFAVRRTNLDEVFFKDPSVFRSTRLLDFSEFAVQRVRLEGSKEIEPGTLELKKSDDATWEFVQPPFGLAEMETSPLGKDDKEKDLFATKPPEKKSEGGVKALLNAISSLRVPSEDDFVALPDTDIAAFGLEEGKAKLQIEVVIAEAKKERKETLLVGFPVLKGKDQYYARLKSDQAVAKISKKELEPILKILKEPGVLRSTDLARLDARQVDAIDLRLGKDDTVRLRRPEGTQWKLSSTAGITGRGDARSIQNMIDTLQGKRQIVKFFDATGDDAKKLDEKLGFDSPAAEVTLWVSSLEKEVKKDPKKDAKDDKKEKKEEKKDSGDGFRMKENAKPAVTLIFGKTEGDQVYVKRITRVVAESKEEAKKDGKDTKKEAKEETKEHTIITRAAVPKAIIERVAPPAGALAFLDSTLPPFTAADAVSFELVRGKEMVAVERGKGEQAWRWLLKLDKASAGQNFADTPQVERVIDILGSLHVRKWVKKIDPKDDLDKYGLKSPAITLRFTLRRFPPGAIANGLGMLGSLAPTGPLLMAAALQLDQSDKGETVVFQFGKETAEEKDKPGLYVSRSGVDYLFLVNPELAKMLKDVDLRDRSLELALQPVLDAGLVALAASAGSADWLRFASPFVSGRVHDFDPDKVKEIKITTRGAELRTFAFQRKDKTWEDKTGLQEFNLDPERVTLFLKTLANLRAERLVSLAGEPKSWHKLGDKEASLRVELVLEGGGTLTLKTGAMERGSYYAQTSAWPGVIFLLPFHQVEPLRSGPSYFSKDRVAFGP